MFRTVPRPPLRHLRPPCISEHGSQLTQAYTLNGIGNINHHDCHLITDGQGFDPVDRRGTIPGKRQQRQIEFSVPEAPRGEVTTFEPEIDSEAALL